MSFSWSVTGTIPPGLALDPNLGILSGIPTAAGTYNFTVTVTELRSVPLTAFEVVDGVGPYIISSDSGQAKQPFAS